MTLWDEKLLGIELLDLKGPGFDLELTDSIWTRSMICWRDPRGLTDSQAQMWFRRFLENPGERDRRPMASRPAPLALRRRSL